MAFFDITRGFVHDLYVVGGELIQHSITVQATKDRGVGHSVVTAHNFIVSDRKVTTDVAMSESLPNVFYGVVESSGASFEFDNFDNEFTHFRDTKPYKAPVRIRQYDPINNEIINLYEGQVSSFSIGRTIKIGTQSLDLTALDAQLPKNKIVDTSNPPPQGVNPLDVTTTFKDAPDNGRGIPIIFGKAVGVSCAAIKRDLENQVFDYLVSEDSSVVEKVEKLSNGKWNRAFTTTGTVVGAGDTNDGRSYLLIPRSNPWSTEDDRFHDLILSIINGKGALQSKRIVEHYSLDDSVVTKAELYGIPLPDPVPRLVIFDDPWTVIPDGFSVFEIREYQVFPGTEYTRRTSIKFLDSQSDEGSPKSLRADVTQYQRVRKNKLAWTDHADKFTTDDTVQWWQHLGLEGHYDPAAYDPGAYVTSLSVSEPVRFLSTSIDAPYGSPIDTLGAVILPGAPGNGICIQNTGVQPKGEDWTVSGWFLSGDGVAHDVTVFIELSDETNHTTQVVSATPTIGSRFSLTVTMPVSSETVRVGFYSTANEQITIAPFALQCEIGSTATYPERVDYPGKARVWSFPDAIRRLLTDPIYGQGQGVSVVSESFEAANEKLWPYWLSCHGALSDITGSGGQVLEVLNEMLQVRGMFLRTHGAAIAIDVDDVALSAIQTVGYGHTTQENKLINVEPIEYLDSTRLVKTLELSYGLQFKVSTEEAGYRYLVKKDIQTIGSDKREITLRFVADHNTADRALQYIAARLKLNASTWRVTAGPIARAWRVKDVITVVAPEYQTENLLVSNEDLTGTGWTYDAGAGTPNAGFTRFGRTRSTTELSAGAIVRQDIATDCDDRNMIVALASYSELPSEITISIKDGAILKKSVGAKTGKGWTSTQLEYEYSGSATPRVQLEVTGANPVRVSHVQACRDYLYGYTPTTTDPVEVDPQQSWQIASLDKSNIDSIQASLIPYIASEIYGFTASDYSTALIDQSSLDPTLTAPLPVTEITLPPDPSLKIPTAHAGVDISTDNQVNSWAIITFLMPDDPLLAKVELQIRKTGEPAWSTKAVVTSTETPINTVGSVLLQNLTPGLSYDIRFISYNTRGVTSGYQLIQSFVAYGDTVAPDAPTGLVAEQGTGRSVGVTVWLSPDPVTRRNKVPSDFGGVRYYRAVTVSAAPPSEAEWSVLAEPQGFSYTDTDVEYLKYYWYRATVYDKSGNESGFFTKATPVQIALIHGGVEIQDGTITGNKLVVGSITTNQLSVGSYDNIIDNPGFEKGIVTWPLPAGWAVVENESRRSGGYSLKAEADGFLLSDTKIHVAVGDPIYVEGYVYSAGSSTALITLGLFFFSSTDTLIGGVQTNVVATSTLTGGFTKLAKKGWVVANAQYAKAFIQLGSYDAGAVYFDDLFARKQIGSAEIETLRITGASVVDGVDSLTIVRGTGSEIVFVDEVDNEVATIDVHTTFNAVSIKSAVGNQGYFSIGLSLGDGDIYRFSQIGIYADQLIDLTATTSIALHSNDLLIASNNVYVNDSIMETGSFSIPATASAKLFLKKDSQTYWVPMFPVP